MLVDIHGKIKSLFFVHLFYGMTNGIFVSLFNFFSTNENPKFRISEN